MDLSWRARLQHIDRGWVDMAFTVPLIGLLALSPRTRLGSEVDIDRGFGRTPGWRRAPNSRRQPTVAATLDARSSATRGDRGVDLIASAALSAPTTARGPSIGLIANGSPPPPQRNHHSDRAVGMRLLHIGADRVHPLEMHRLRPRPTWCSVLDLGIAGCSRSRHLPTVGVVVSPMSADRSSVSGEQRDGIDLTNLDQPLGPDAEATKRDLVNYLEASAAARPHRRPSPPGQRRTA